MCYFSTNHNFRKYAERKAQLYFASETAIDVYLRGNILSHDIKIYEYFSSN